MFKKQFCNVFSVLYQNRYCSQENFDIISSRSLLSSSIELVKLHYPSLKRMYPILTSKRQCYTSVVANSDIYTLCGKHDSKVFEYVGKYSEKHKYTKTIGLPENVTLQLACLFKKDLIVFSKSLRKRKHCLKYNIKTLQWTYISDWNSYREYAACTIFEGKIIVSGGRTVDAMQSKTRTVESYDYYENKWTYLSDMTVARYKHGAVSMGNKMFVIGGFLI